MGDGTNGNWPTKRFRQREYTSTHCLPMILNSTTGKHKLWRRRCSNETGAGSIQGRVRAPQPWEAMGKLHVCGGMRVNQGCRGFSCRSDYGHFGVEEGLASLGLFGTGQQGPNARFQPQVGQGRPNIAGASTASRHDVEIPGLTGAWTAQL